jgi:D-alanine transfer protein
MLRRIVNTPVGAHLLAAGLALLIAFFIYVLAVGVDAAPLVSGLYLSNLNSKQHGRGAEATANYARLSNMIRSGKGVVIFGSSELSSRELRFIPYNYFPQSCNIPVIAYGHAQYQSLGIYGLLASLSGDLNRDSKIVIFVSPGWFDKGDMLPQAFAEHLNDDVLLKAYQYPSPRGILENYLRLHQKYFKQLTEIQKLFINPKRTASDDAYLALEASEEDVYFARMKLLTFVTAPDASSSSPDDSQFQCSLDAMQSYEHMAQAIELSYMTNNRVYVRNTYFSKFLKMLPPQGENYFADHLDDEPERQDFIRLLGLLRDHDVHPLVIMLPLNPYVYKDTAKIKPEREELKTICTKYQAGYVDMAAVPYVPGLLQDTVHPGELGFLKIDEIIYKYFGLK